MTGLKLHSLLRGDSSWNLFLHLPCRCFLESMLHIHGLADSQDLRQSLYANFGGLSACWLLPFQNLHLNFRTSLLCLNLALRCLHPSKAPSFYSPELCLSRLSWDQQLSVFWESPTAWEPFRGWQGPAFSNCTVCLRPVFLYCSQNNGLRRPSEDADSRTQLYKTTLWRFIKCKTMPPSLIFLFCKVLLELYLTCKFIILRELNICIYFFLFNF